MVTAEQLAELRLLHERAKPAPWVHTVDEDTGGGGVEPDGNNDPDGWVFFSYPDGTVVRPEDAALIAAVRNMLPDLIEAAERGLR